MDLKLVRSTPSELDTDAVVLFQLEGSERDDLKTALAHSYSSGEIKGKPFEFTLVHNLPGYKARRVLVAGAGKQEKFDSAAVRKNAGAAVRFLKGKGITTVAFALGAGESSAANVTAAVEGAILGAWEPDALKTSADEKSKPLALIVVAVESQEPALDAALEKGRVVAEAANLTRDISVEPPNVLTPMALAARARAMAEANGLSIEIVDQDRMRQLGMGALLGVAQGSINPPALIVMRYTPPKVTSKDHLALIGKGVTFDTGG